MPMYYVDLRVMRPGSVREWKSELVSVILKCRNLVRISNKNINTWY